MRTTSRTLSVLVAGALVAAACGGSDSSEVGATVATAEEATDTVPPDTEAEEVTTTESAPPDTGPPTTETDAGAADAGSADAGSADAGSADAGSADAGDEVASGDPFSEPLIPADQVDDVAVCQAFAPFFNRLGAVAFAALFVGLDAELEGGDGGDDFVLESLELLAFAGLGDDVAVIRAAAPDVVVTSLDPVFGRIEEAEAFLRDAGFSDDELAAIDRSFDLDEEASEIDGLLEDDARLRSAAEARRAAGGSLLEIAEGLGELGADSEAAEAEADAWLESTCPMVASVLDE